MPQTPSQGTHSFGGLNRHNILAQVPSERSVSYVLADGQDHDTLLVGRFTGQAYERVSWSGGKEGVAVATGGCMG